jgi:hypothetical protein
MPRVQRCRGGNGAATYGHIFACVCVCVCVCVTVCVLVRVCAISKPQLPTTVTLDVRWPCNKGATTGVFRTPQQLLTFERPPAGATGALPEFVGRTRGGGGVRRWGPGHIDKEVRKHDTNRQKKGPRQGVRQCHVCSGAGGETDGL